MKQGNLMKIQHIIVLSICLPSLGFAQTINAGSCNVLYWPNKNMGFGHAALEVFMPGNMSKNPDVYLSWAKRNVKKEDMNFHKREPKIIELDGISREDFVEFQAWFISSIYINSAEQYGSQYHLFKNNCAHAVVEGLRSLGFSVNTKPHRFALRPQEAYRNAKKIRARLP